MRLSIYLHTARISHAKEPWMPAMLLLFLGVALGIIPSIMANVVTGPILSLASRHKIVVALSRIPFASNKELQGDWLVTWTVDSPGYPSVNTGATRIESFMRMLTFSTVSAGYDAANRYLYVGETKGGIVSGRWYDPGPDSYHGMFQMRWNGTRTIAIGKWIGWAANGTVKVGDLELKR
jgi:hypothetical protein